MIKIKIEFLTLILSIFALNVLAAITYNTPTNHALSAEAFDINGPITGNALLVDNDL